MTRIDTEIPEVIVEIDDKEYPVAPRTIEVMDRLIAAQRANANEPNYRLWLAELEILLGREACGELFVNGRAENVDRIQMIYAGVARAFQRTDQEITASLRERDMQSVATGLAPVNELLKNLRMLDRIETKAGSIREIPRK